MTTEKKSIGFFEKNLTIWVALCIAAGIIVSQVAGTTVQQIAKLEVASVNIPVAMLVWLMIYPMMVQIDFSSLKNTWKKPKGLALTVVMNWLIKPFTMAFFAWVFFDKLYAAYITPELAKEYIAGAILLGAAPCTAMVFVWSYLTDGDPEYTLVQVAVNDIILIFAFVPIVKFLLNTTSVEIPYDTLVLSVVIFVVIPLVAGGVTNKVLRASKGEAWFKDTFLPALKPISITALLATLILLFSFQGDKIISNPYDIVLIAIPLAIQTYFIFFLAWLVGKALGIKFPVLAPATMIGASNFFELAVAVAIALFGLNSGAALVTVVGVLIEVPVMLHLVSIANKLKFN